MANQPRYRDAAIVLFVAGVIGVALALDIGVRAVAGLPETWDSLARSFWHVCSHPKILEFTPWQVL